MTVLLLWAALSLPAPASRAGAVPVPLAVGRVFHYHVGVFATVARNRGMRLDWAGADGFASVPDCGKVNARRPWYVRATVAGRLLTLQVVDCSAPRDLAHQLRLGLVLEVDWRTAHRLGFATYHGDTGPGHAPARIWGYTQAGAAR